MLTKPFARGSLLLVVLFLGVVQAIAEETSDELVESKVLKSELQALLAETLQAAREAGKPEPAEMTADKMSALLV